MKPRPPLPAGPYLVVGLARSGLAAALALRARGEEVIGWDAGAGDQPQLADHASRLRDAGIEVHLDASGDGDLHRARSLIKSPGVPQAAPVVAAARSRGIPVLGELELAWRLLANEFVAVTGTNGKTTTTEWIGHMYRMAGMPVAVAGNVGTAACTLVGSIPSEITVVCEASSFQLEDCVEFAPDEAVLLNVTPDHLDRHPSFSDYVSAKLRIFAHQDADDVAVVPEPLDVGPIGGEAKRITFGEGRAADLRAVDGNLIWKAQKLLHTDALALPGAHNRQNGMAAAAACLARGISTTAVVEGLKTFEGVAHRLELVTVIAGVAFVNDSKATNVASTEVALAAYERGIHLIAGGRGKGQDFSPLTSLVGSRCKAVYLIGEAAEAMAAQLVSTEVPLTSAGRLEQALALAREAAQPGDTVLLSPACASYDQYSDFEERGEHFRELVESG